MSYSAVLARVAAAAVALGAAAALAQEAAPSAAPSQSSSAAAARTQAIPEQEIPLAELLRRNGGSLYQAGMTISRATTKKPGAGSYFSVPAPEPKTIKKHDLVTIIIREETEMNTQGTTDLKKSADVDARVQEWLKFNPSKWQLQGGGQGAVPPSVKASASRNLKGEATVDRTDSFITRITAEVVDVKPNGTFAVQARKSIKNDDETQEYVLTGVCRAEDLTADNTLLSTQIHDLQVVTTHQGAVRDTTKRGLIPQLLDFVNPF